MTTELKITDKQIEHDHPLFVIDEMSGNHQQSLNCVQEIVNMAESHA